MTGDQDIEERARRRVGTTLNGKYRLDALVGVGGTACVYRATHRNRAQFAVKVLHAEHSVRKDVRARFLREGYAANSVGHVGAVLVVDDDVDEEGSAFLVMELLDGTGVESIGARFPEGAPSPIAGAIVHQLLDVLDAAHCAGIVHRDIKPGNLFVLRDGTVKVLDFGIARVFEAGGNPLATGAGVAIGTPAFMAPEQALGRTDEIDARTDVWAAGATLFMLLSGKAVHEASTSTEVLVRAATRPAAGLLSVAPSVAPALAAVIDRALAFERDARWPTARAMADALADALGGVPDKQILAALVPPRSGTLRPGPDSAAIASAPTLDASDPRAYGASASGIVDPVASAPTLAALPPHETSAPVASPVLRPRSRRLALLGGIAAIALAALLGSWLVARSRHPQASAGAPSAPASASLRGSGPPLVLVASSDNRTGEASFDGVIDAMAESALKGSPGLYALGGPSMHADLTEYAPPSGATEDAIAGLVAERTKRPVVLLHSTITKDGAGYALTISATEAGATASILDERQRAASADRVGPTVARLVCDVRAAMHEAPCDETSRVRTGLSDSIEADHEFVVGRGAQTEGRLADAVPPLERAALLDPNFTRARLQLGLALLNSGRSSEGQAQLDLARARRDMLSERDALQLDSTYFLVRGEFRKAIRAYEELLARWPADTRVRSNLASAYDEEGDFRRALEVGLLAAKEHPHLVITRCNLVSFSLVVGDLEQVLSEAHDVLDEFPHPTDGVYALGAAASTLLGRPNETAVFRGKLARANPSLAAELEADLAMFEGRLDDAVRGLRAGIAADDAHKQTSEAHAKSAMLAEALLRQGNLGAARDAAARAAESQELFTMFRAARVLAAAGKPDVAVLLGRPGDHAPLLARLVEAEVRTAKKAPADAAAALGTLETTGGSWLAHADLGAAYLAARAFEDAERELALCVQLRTVGATLFYEDRTTLRYLPPVYYMLARAKDALHRPDAPAAYAAFLALEPDAQGDPLVREARKRSRADAR